MVNIGGINMSGNYICGAYPSAPSLHSDDKDAETAFYDRLRSMPQIGGIEFRFGARQPTRLVTRLCNPVCMRIGSM